MPENVTGYDTYTIVNKIRCEARDAIQHKVIGLLAHSPSAKTRDIAQRIKDGVLTFDEVNRNRSQLDQWSRFFIEKYDGTAIAYDFTFDITENNNIGGSVGFVAPLHYGTASLGLKADANRQRENTRNFRVVDTFEELLFANIDCSNNGAGKNWTYPIAGSIGQAELISTFLDLNESQNLSTKEKDKVPILADTFAFQTTLDVSATPMIVLSPVGTNFQLASAQFTATGIRQDIHKVIIALSLPPEPKARAPRPGLVRSLSPSRVTPAAQRALDELDNQINRNFISDTTKIRQRLNGF